MSQGDDHYRKGEFDAAERAYAEALEADPTDVAALAGAGAVALLHNRLDVATRWLERAVAEAPDHLPALRNLAEAAYRQDNFAGAGAWLRRVAAHAGDAERANSEVIARKLASFEDRVPYRTDHQPDEVRVPLDAADPLPVLTVTLGDRVQVPFFIDTGGHEIYVDEHLAAELGLASFGTTHGAAAGGKLATEGHARLDSMTLGGLRIHDIPVKTLDFAALGFADALGGTPVKGVVGTAFLYHFLSTVDYEGGALILRPRTPETLAEFERVTAGAQLVPFWLSGTHFLVARGAVNDSGPLLLVVDTGGAGLGFVATGSTIERAGIALSEDDAITGPGAGGAARAIPFSVDKLSLGDVSAGGISGVFFPDTDLERDLGREFPVGGIISHQFLRPYALTFDFVRMRLFLAPPR